VEKSLPSLRQSRPKVKIGTLDEKNEEVRTAVRRQQIEETFAKTRMEIIRQDWLSRANIAKVWIEEKIRVLEAEGAAWDREITQTLGNYLYKNKKLSISKEEVDEVIYRAVEEGGYVLIFRRFQSASMGLRGRERNKK
jgi:hypothetical protein